jgi:carboxylesterase
VATLDNDAERIFQGSVEFIRSVLSIAGAVSAFPATPGVEVLHEQA